jgi:hypothetical protein
MPAGFWSTVTNGGGDIRVYESDGTTELPREVVSCDTATDTGELHFKGDVSALSDTDFIITVDGTSSDYAVTDTYGRNAVWSGYAHKQIGDTDATGNTTTTKNGVTLSGTVNGFAAIDNDGTPNNNLQFDDNTGDFTGDLSLSAWLTIDATTNNGTIIGIREGSDWEFHFRTEVGNQPALLIGSGSPNSTANLNLNQDYHVAVTVSGTDIAFYVDGVSAGTGTVSGSRSNRSYYPTLLGINNDNGNYLDARIALTGIRQDALSSDWIATEYANQSSPSTFYTIT